MQSIMRRFLSFDQLIGPFLVKLVYYVGAIAIVFAAGFGVLMGLLAIFSGNFGSGIVQLIAVPAVGAVGLVYWRFVCELFMLAFLAYDRMGEIRNSLRIATGEASAPDPNHPAF